MQPLLAALGVAPTLTVRGRKTGKPYTFPVLLAEYEGRRYLVAPRGNTQWARNLRVAGEADLKVARRRRHVRATEVAAVERQPIIDAYRQQHARDYGRFLAAEFAAIPNPADHPVFLLQDL